MRAAPDKAAIMSHRPRVAQRASVIVISARIPPSPWLSARITKKQYLMDIVPEQVVEGGRLAAEAALAADQNEIALAQHLVDGVVLHDDASLPHCFECGTETREPIANLRVVLDGIVTFELAGHLGHLSLDD